MPIPDRSTCRLAVPKIPQPRRPYYGWVMLPLTTWILVCTAPGQTFGISVFNPYIMSGLELTASQLSGAYLLASLLAAAPMPWVGALIDRHGPKSVALVVGVLLGVACLFISRAGGLVGLTIGFLLLRTLGQGALSLVANNSLAMWYSRRLGSASGLAGVGVAAGVAFMPALYLTAIERFGWRDAYLLIGLATWVALIPAIALLFQNRPEDVGQRIDGDAPTPTADPATSTVLEFSLEPAAARRTRSFWIVLGLCGSWGMIGTGIAFHLLPLCEGSGIGNAAAARTYITFAACMAVGQLGGGVLADRVRLNRLFAVSTLGLAGGVAALWAMDSIWHAHLYAALFGLAQGVLLSVNNTVWPRYFGRAHLGKIRGSVWTVTVASCSVGPLLMGLSVDTFGSYRPALGLFTAILAGWAVAAVFATPPARPGD